MIKQDVVDWINASAGNEVFIGKDGLTLVTERDAYLEVGGEPEEDVTEEHNEQQDKDEPACADILFGEDTA